MPYLFTPEEKEKIANLCDYILSSSDSPIEIYLAQTALYIIGVPGPDWVYEINVTSWVLNDASSNDNVKLLATWVAARLAERGTE